MSNGQLPDTIDFSPRSRWENRHQTVDQKIGGIYTIWNPDLDDKLETYHATTKAFQALIAKAEADNKRLHALGGGWSLSDISVSDDFLVNTKPLRLRFRIKPERLSADYQGNPNNLFFIQCGNSITRLNRYLKANKRSLKTSGSSNGQTVVGAFSTGTHGSRIDFGAFQEFVVGLHIIVAKDRHIWLERKSYPVTVADFANKLEAERIQDDQLFNAALVSFGAFGFIHGVMVETERRFLLESYQLKLPYDQAMIKAINTLNFSSLQLPVKKRPYHFEVIFNPNADKRDPYVKVMYKRPYRPDYPHPERETDEPGLGDGALAVIGRVLDQLPANLIRSQINQSVAEQFQEPGPKWGTLGEIFSSETVRGKTLSAAMAVSLTDAEKALEAAYAAHDNHSALFPGLISLRYAKGSPALLAFTRFNECAILEVDSIYSDQSMAFLRNVWQQLDDRNIPFTVHWGKLNELNAQTVKSMYGNAVDQWIEARHSLLGQKERAIFSNPFLEKTGLSL
ncbi:MAG: FAD-binding protein [Gammaproteobacteria bacterium]|nr:FAD-binding protein [Gammaproteobacteria bacterium]